MCPFHLGGTSKCKPKFQQPKPVGTPSDPTPAVPCASPSTKTSSPSAGGSPSRPCAAGVRNSSDRSTASSAAASPTSCTKSKPSSGASRATRPSLGRTSEGSGHERSDLLPGRHRRHDGRSAGDAGSR